MVNNKKIQALKNASLSKHDEMLQRAINAIKLMQEKNIPINFEAVEKYSGVSKTCLYRNAKIKAQINKLRAKDGIIKKSVDLHALIQKKDTKITKLEKKIKSLQKKNAEIKNQLEAAYGEIYRLNSGIK